jgi:hypothetical protein
MEIYIMVKSLLSSFFGSRVRFLITMCTLIGGLAGVVQIVIAFDGRYEHKLTADQKYNDLQVSISKGRLEDRREQLQNKIFELQATQKLTAPVLALIDRYKSQLRAIDEQLARMVESSNSN